MKPQKISFPVTCLLLLLLFGCNNHSGSSAQKHSADFVENKASVPDSVIKSVLYQKSPYAVVDSTMNVNSYTDSVVISYRATREWTDSNPAKLIHLPDWAYDTLVSVTCSMALDMRMLLDSKGKYINSTVTDTVFNYYKPVIVKGEHDSSVDAHFDNGLSAQIEDYTFNNLPIAKYSWPRGDSIGTLKNPDTLLKSDYYFDYLGGELAFTYVHIPAKHNKAYWLCARDGMFSHEEHDSIGSWSDLHLSLYLRKVAGPKK